MKKRTYESPLLSRTTIEVEGDFMSASVFEPKESGKGVTIEGHEISDEIGFPDESGFNNSWD